MLRRLASRFKSSITGSAPVPVPTTRRRHFHGICERQRRVSKVVAEFLVQFLLAFADLAAVDHHVVFVDDAINADRAESKVLKTHNPSLRQLYSATLRPPALQDEVALDTAEEIRIKLTPKERTLLTRVHAIDPEAHDDYLRGRSEVIQLAECAISHRRRC